jgi:GAF domain-containing protein
MDAAYATSIDSDHQTIDSVIGDIGALALAPRMVFPLQQTYCSRMLRGEMPRVIPDTRAEPAVQDLAATREIGAYIGVPVTLSDGRVHGTLCCASHNPRPGLGSDELKFMQVLADIVATLVDRAQRELAGRTA